MGPSAITIGFSTTNKWISRVIRWLTRSPVSHAWIGFESPTLEISLVLQAEAWGVELRPRSRWSKENIAKASFAVGADPGGRILRQFIKDVLGAGYDWRGAGLVGWIGWLRRWGRSRFSLRPSRTPSRLMCAELVVRYLHRLGLVPEMDEEVTPPVEILQWALSGGLPRLWLHEELDR